MQNNSDYQQYVNTVNGFITTLNNNAAYLNHTNQVIAHMFNCMDYAYNEQSNESSYMRTSNNRRRRLNMPDIERPASPLPEIPIVEPTPEVVEPTPEVVEPVTEPPQAPVNDIYSDMSVVNLTAAINRHITRMKYSDVVNPSETFCAITQEEFEPDDIVGVFNSCKHIFNYDALISWLVREQTCPCCRSNILANTNLISYKDDETGQHLVLTLTQFSRYLIRDLFGGNLNFEENLDMVAR